MNRRGRGLRKLRIVGMSSSRRADPFRAAAGLSPGVYAGENYFKLAPLFNRGEKIRPPVTSFQLGRRTAVCYFPTSWQSTEEPGVSARTYEKWPELRGNGSLARRGARRSPLSSAAVHCEHGQASSFGWAGPVPPLPSPRLRRDAEPCSLVGDISRACCAMGRATKGVHRAYGKSNSWTARPVLAGRKLRPSCSERRRVRSNSTLHREQSRLSRTRGYARRVFVVKRGSAGRKPGGSLKGLPHKSFQSSDAKGTRGKLT